jgi:SAM-dependent methyltransferase
LRARWQGQKLFCVDPWKAYYGVDMDDAAHESYYQQARENMRRVAREGEQWEFMRMTGLEAAKRFADQGMQFDFVFLDDDHDYQPVLDEIDAWWPLVKPGGLLTGHDWVIDGWHLNGEPFKSHPTRPAANQCGPFFVQKAVLERFKLEEIALTSPETDLGWQSWAVRKPL